MIIRKETRSDIEAITEITKLAFKDHPYSRQTEQFIITALRCAGDLTLSLVAQEDDQVVGHIAFSPVTFTDGTENWFGIGPFSVSPEYQRQGIGTKLLTEGLQILKESNAKGCILVGDPQFYGRFGFKSPVGLQHEGVPQENLLALPFNHNETPKGQVHFHPAFFATE